MTEPKYRLVFFDVDSTLVTIEGIDVLAGGNPEIAKLTEAAMNGEVSVDEVYAKRLEIIRPSRAAIDALGARYVASLVDGAADAIVRLRSVGVAVHLVTAGIAQAIAPLAAHLGIAPRSVHAVILSFDGNGEYLDFDRASPLTRSGGKEIVVRDVRARSKGKAAFVGDGVTDLETKRVVDLFIGFGGAHVRPRVKENAAVFVTDFRSVLSHLLA
ncbi:MAG TPA: HAD-IB family phosphatase [Thermoanaerobaculia bacterium]